MQVLAADEALAPFLFGVLFGFFIVGLFYAVTRRGSSSKSPKLAGSIIPELADGLDLSKRYDITYTGDWNANYVERVENVRIMGYVGSDRDENISKMYMRGRWLVVEHVDRRRVYLMPSAIVALRETVTSA